MRPLQRKLAAKLGIQWNDFALISPDTWRRALLDFGSLGPLYKYAGMLTSHEVTIIDRKLDVHLVRKGDKQQTSHLMIDRFRFDSFALDSDESKHLPSRFGNLLCYSLMVTPRRKPSNARGSAAWNLAATRPWTICWRITWRRSPACRTSCSGGR